MLFNPKWKTRETTLENFLAWLEIMPPRESYVYMRSDICACGQWLRHIGRYHGLWCNPKYMRDTPLEKANKLAASQPHTFGSLAKRVRAEIERRECEAA